ncbi:hypothetical protein F442_11788 [Phytophthora nicotianae P10297]|uniref:Uncharacterized protein n=1 Tax=Phytophthora nicotianae P10297 TaxID=1317064 RepID=W2Z409_PHYNI|nr:hypothetical protein F442_11788 [Phytophthora nicotianae P10297]
MNKMQLAMIPRLGDKSADKGPREPKLSIEHDRSAN